MNFILSSVINLAIKCRIFLTVNINKSLVEYLINGEFMNIDGIRRMVDNGADVQCNNNLAVKVASLIGNIDVVKYLVGKGADINSGGNYPVCFASQNGHLKVVKYLVEKGADFRVDNNCAVRWASRVQFRVCCN